MSRYTSPRCRSSYSHLDFVFLGFCLLVFASCASIQPRYVAEQSELLMAEKERVAAEAAATRAIERYCSLHATMEPRLQCQMEKWLDVQVRLQFASSVSRSARSTSAHDSAASGAAWFTCDVNPLRTNCQRRALDVLAFWQDGIPRASEGRQGR